MARTYNDSSTELDFAPKGKSIKSKGIVFDIMKFAVHDGPGIRTTVFLKGCPLRCLWCHNPESQEMEPELSFIPGKCIGCGYCLKSCPANCHKMENGIHVLYREKCVRCGICAKECHAQALDLIGKEMSVKKVADEVMKDSPFYETSGGGLTVSGGEPMMQFEFTLALLKEAKSRGLHVCMETCGFAPLNRFEMILPFVDIFLFDVKETDDAKHKEFTGVPWIPILSALEFLDSKNANIALRCPLIPGLNARPDHFKAIGELAERLKNVSQINVEPYHPLGISKTERIGKKTPLQNLTGFPEKDEVVQWVEAIQSYTLKSVSIS